MLPRFLLNGTVGFTTLLIALVTRFASTTYLIAPSYVSMFIHLLRHAMHLWAAVELEAKQVWDRSQGELLRGG